MRGLLGFVKVIALCVTANRLLAIEEYRNEKGFLEYDNAHRAEVDREFNFLKKIRQKLLKELNQ